MITPDWSKLTTEEKLNYLFSASTHLEQRMNHISDQITVHIARINDELEKLKSAMR